MFFTMPKKHIKNYGCVKGKGSHKTSKYKSLEGNVFLVYQHNHIQITRIYSEMLISYQIRQILIEIYFHLFKYSYLHQKKNIKILCEYVRFVYDVHCTCLRVKNVSMFTNINASSIGVVNSIHSYSLNNI